MAEILEINNELDLPAETTVALARGTLTDPFSVLGPHVMGDAYVVRVFLPGAMHVELETEGGSRVSLQPRQVEGLFVGRLSQPERYRLYIQWPGGMQETEDPYATGLLLGDFDLHLIGEGNHFELAHCLGAHPCRVDGVEGVRFAIWAPNARRVAVVGDFNSWDARRHGMRHRVESGIWELFIPRLGTGDFYQYQIIGACGPLPLKSDPLAQQMELPPRTASVVCAPLTMRWSDQHWIEGRASRHQPSSPISIYEVHAGSWRRPRHHGDHVCHWDDLAEHLIPYVASLGFTHIELMPITAHPYSGSWGYQPLGLFAPQPEYGDREAFARFVDRCHNAGLGVLLDWVPAHFPGDAHGLARFDGTALYEHEDMREGFHLDWKTWIYNVGRREVSGFLLASALYWLEQFHIDGLRVDAVSSMLYRDYSREADQWVPNRFGGRENLEAIEFLRRLNHVVSERVPGALLIAEESTAWPGVSRSPEQGGLGFSFKWNMGWMHDTLDFMRLDPIYRRFEGHKLTFGLIYAFSEQFVLPLSHDEVVHGKGSLLGKMPGDRRQQMANLRTYLSFMWTHPGKKLLFMGGELAQEHEWNHDGELPWELLGNPLHHGVQQLVRDLNHLYRREPALHVGDCESTGFQWVVADDHEQSVFAFLRLSPNGDASPALIVCNFTPVSRHRYRVGVPLSGFWREAFNSDAERYGGSNIGNGGGCDTLPMVSHGMSSTLELTLPPLSALVLLHQ